MILFDMFAGVLSNKTFNRIVILLEVENLMSSFYHTIVFWCTKKY